ncbi:hypothetical protein MKZ38_001471 [Zalerion maritima]|uniref:Protein BFR2 n=1 Tax=Zalerion maritima TaxID=339359 RepID=A0AAD5WVJ6_9PEZI|nr:hypothetical protein MKZ38_001471 [Zalerion maritima]
MAKLKGRAAEFAKLEECPKKDFDPEAEPPSENSQSESESSDEEERLATEHYVPVGKSKLRQKEPVSLGPKYSGSRVSRAALEGENSGSEPVGSESEGEDDEDGDQVDEGGSEDEEDDEREHADLIAVNLDVHNVIDDEEIDSDNALGESDQEQFKDFVFRGSSKPRPGKKEKANRPKAADWLESSSDEEMVENEYGSEDQDIVEEDGEFEDMDSDEDVDMDAPEELNGYPEAGSDDDNDTSEDEDEEESEGSDDESSSPGKDQSASAAFTTGVKSTVSRLSASAQKEAKQGTILREQRKTFDSILNLRVRLQKSLVATNSLAAVETDDESEHAYEAAEEAAIKLWNTLDLLRAQMDPDAYSQLNTKRKREADTSTPSGEMWEHLAVVEKRAATLRKKNLEKWSEKANRGFITSGRDNAKNAFTIKETLTASLDGQLANPERLVKKTQIPRSCAPLQAKSNKTDDVGIYDDADFYQLLLKELVDQRTSNSNSTNGAVTTVVYTAQKEAKQKKVVDTKASKGRKMRFNVHEKLVNFTSREDRRSWEESAIDRLLGSLFGKKFELDEDDESESDEEGGVSLAEENALRLFRN